MVLEFQINLKIKIHQITKYHKDKKKLIFRNIEIFQRVYKLVISMLL